MTDPLLSPAELADLVGVPVKTVYAWRQNHTGPVGIRVGKHVRFRLSSVDAWLRENTDAPPEAPEVPAASGAARPAAQPATRRGPTPQRAGSTNGSH